MAERCQSCGSTGRRGRCTFAAGGYCARTNREPLEMIACPSRPMNPGKRRSCAASEFLTHREAARRLGVDRATTLCELIAAGQIRTVPVGNHARIPIAEIERIAKFGAPASRASRERRSKKPPCPARDPAPDVEKVRPASAPRRGRMSSVELAGGPRNFWPKERGDQSGIRPLVDRPGRDAVAETPGGEGRELRHLAGAADREANFSGEKDPR